MKKILIKIPAILAVLISLLSVVFFLTAAIYALIEVTIETETMGVSDSFLFWFLSLMAALFSLTFYFIDAMISLAYAFRKINPSFNFVLAAILLGGIPMTLFVDTRLGIYCFLWFSYYLAMLILEIVSIIKHIKMTRDSDGRMTLVDDDEMTPLKAPRTEKRLDAPDPFRLK
jgi:hypothetical protein